MIPILISNFFEFRGILAPTTIMTTIFNFLHCRGLIHGAGGHALTPATGPAHVGKRGLSTPPRQ